MKMTQKQSSDHTAYAASESGFSILNALIALSVVLMAAMALPQVFKTAGTMQNLKDTQRSLEDYRLAITNAIIDGLRLYRAGNCTPGTFIATFNKLPVGTHGVVSYSAAPLAAITDVPPGMAAAAARCASPTIPSAGSTSMHACFQALHDSDVALSSIDSRSFFLTQMAFVEVRFDFISSGFNNSPMACNYNPDPTYSWFAPYGRLHISFYWRNMLGSKSVSRFYQDHRTSFVTLQ
jgi:type II secretory pathway pseudopilin PulG